MRRRNLCRLAEDQIAGARCSILLFDPERGLLRHGAAPNLPPAYNAAIDLLHKLQAELGHDLEVRAAE